jgi:hypothetical protein
VIKHIYYPLTPLRGIRRSDCNWYLQ